MVGSGADRKNIPDACIYAAEIAARQVAGKYIPINQLSLDEGER